MDEIGTWSNYADHKNMQYINTNQKSGASEDETMQQAGDWGLTYISHPQQSLLYILCSLYTIGEPIACCIRKKRPVCMMEAVWPILIRSPVSSLYY